jgi:hypothetical protein
MAVPKREPRWYLLFALKSAEHSRRDYVLMEVQYAEPIGMAGAADLAFAQSHAVVQ